MEEDRVRAFVIALDTASSAAQEAAWSELRGLGGAVVPHLAAFYPKARTWQGRVALVFHSIRYARLSDDAFVLGLAALRDKSYMVRYRACGLLAYSLRRDAIPELEPLLKHSDRRTVEDAAAAIDAIRNQNHHYFVDRSHSGQARWVVTESDRNDAV